MDVVRSLLVLVAVAACRPPWDDVSFVDEGDVCIVQDGDDLAIIVTSPECFSSSCARNVEASCNATVEGDRIELTSEMRWEEKPPRAIGGDCTLDCGRAVAECVVPALPPGSYTVVHGEDELPLVVPVTESCPL